MIDKILEFSDDADFKILQLNLLKEDIPDFRDLDLKEDTEYSVWSILFDLNETLEDAVGLINDLLELMNKDEL